MEYAPVVSATLSAKPSLSIVIPAHNEEECIEETIRRVEATVDVPHEVIVANDHSTDQTAMVVANLQQEFPNLRLVHNQTPGCFGNAVRCGWSSASGEVVVTVMADDCDDPGSIASMYDKILAGDDVVCASRYMPGGEKKGGRRLQSFASRFVGWSLHALLNIPTHDVSNAYKMYRREVLELTHTREIGFAMSMEIALKAHFAGYRVSEIPTLWKDRTAGQSDFRVLQVGRAYARLYLWAIWMAATSRFRLCRARP